MLRALLPLGEVAHHVLLALHEAGARVPDSNKFNEIGPIADNFCYYFRIDRRRGGTFTKKLKQKQVEHRVKRC